MAFLKRTKNWSGIFPKLKVAMAFLKYAEIALASIQLTLVNILAGKQRDHAQYMKTNNRSWGT
jgi:hypothetical protein